MKQETKGAKAKGNRQEAERLQAEALKWEKGGSYRQALSAVTNGIGLALGGAPTEGVVAGTLSPYINTEIKKATEGNDTANILAHGVWGAMEAASQGGSALGGAVAAMTGEVGAKLLAEQLYGQSNPEHLSTEQKQTLSELSQVLAGVTAGTVSGATGGNSLTAVQAAATGMGVAKSAVENNFLKRAMESPNQIVQLGLLEEGNKVKKEIEKKATEEAVEEVIDTADKYAPQYLSFSGQIYGIGAKTAVNLRNGDVVAGWTFSPLVFPNRFGASVNTNMGWITNLDDADLKTLDGARVTGSTINKVIEGNAFGVSGCYKFGCIGYGQTIPNSRLDKKYHSFELGIGIGGNGGSINQERTQKVGNIIGDE